MTVSPRTILNFELLSTSTGARQFYISDAEREASIAGVSREQHAEDYVPYRGARPVITRRPQHQTRISTFFWLLTQDYLTEDGLANPRYRRHDVGSIDWALPYLGIDGKKAS